MSIHCLLCGHQDNWQPDENGDVKEVQVDNKTWVLLRVHNDPDTRLTKKPIDERWVHRVCWERLLSEL